MRKHVQFFGIMMVLVAIIVGTANAQIYSIKDEGSGVIFSPMMHRFNLTQNDLRNLRSQNKDFVFDLSISNSQNRPVVFKTLVGNLEQREDTFQLADLKPETEIYTVKEEEQANPQATLRKIAERIYGDPEQYVFIARLNNLKVELKLPVEILIPKMRAETYEVQPGDLLVKIAKAVYGDEEMATFLAEVNGLQKPYEIHQGQRLYIVKIKKEPYVVQQGDSLEGITQKTFGEKSESIIKLFALANNLTPPYSLTVGQSLTNIPDMERRTVQEGDTLNTVAKAVYGDEYAAFILVLANNVESSYNLADGQTLLVPKIKPRVYTAQTGDTLEKISEKAYGDSSGANLIRVINGIQNPEALNPGQKLYIPEVKPFEFSCASWIKPEEEKFTLQAHEQRRVFFKTKIPGVTISGTYSAIVGVEMEVAPETQEEGIRTEIAPAAYCPVILNIEGRTPLPKMAELHSFEVQEKNGLMGMVFGLRNLGKVMVQVQDSKILILREDRSRLYPPMPLGRGMRIVLPGNRIELGTGINPLPPGKYIAQGTVYFGGRNPVLLEKQFTISGDSKDNETRARTVSFLVSISGKENTEEINIPVIKGRKNIGGVFLNVQNLEANYPLQFKARIIDVPGVEGKYSAGEVLSVRPEQFEVPALRSRNIQIVFKDPQAVAGGRYAQVQIMGYIPEGGKANPIEILSAVRTVDVHEVSTDGLVYKAKETKFTTELKDSLLSSEVEVANTGNIHIQLKPESRVNIMDKIGQLVFSGTLNFQDYIYPGETNKLKLQYDLSKVETIITGQYTIEVILEFYGIDEPIKVSASFDFSKKEKEE
ncbi:MAG: LysM peptidoglycan-binding domain-containing protein [Candidatus Pacebacteria bacterium]|nr:LysM peptidoglycan-binding domain-containing protein [Candidatus Paceibacterota bacterium]